MTRGPSEIASVIQNVISMSGVSNRASMKNPMLETSTSVAHHAAVRPSSVRVIQKVSPSVPSAARADGRRTAHSLKPNMVCLSASTMETALELIPVARGLTEAYPQVHFGYGGRVFNINPELRHSMPGVFLGQDARELVEIAGQLLASGAPPAAG